MGVLLDRADSSPMSDSQSEKDKYLVQETSEELAITHVESRQFGVPEEQFDEIKRIASGYTLEGVRTRITNVLKIHENDPNFPHVIIEKFKKFLEDEDIRANPQIHSPFINEIKIEAALIFYNSPYAEVRGVVDNFDDPNTPCGTIRAWVIGVGFAVLLAFVNQLFSIRQPAIWIGSHIAQLLAYPIGTSLARWLPDWGVTVFGTRHSLNPGPFSKKEHMLISIMASVGGAAPYTTLIVWTQFLPQYFNMEYAGSFAYQICIGLGTNLIGYGLAGVCRRFLVYPAYCVWPTSLVTVSLIAAFHDQKNEPVMGPLKRMITIGRLRFFLYAFGLMFVYFWIPNFFFTALSMFSWITWIAPDNMILNTISGFNNGVGLNPFPTFDWNNIIHSGTDPLMLPFFTTLNKFAGGFVSLFLVLGLWYSNSYSTGYLPLNTNRVYDHFGRIYNITKAINSEGLFNSEGYEKYSPAFLTAGNLTIYVFTFAIYSATFTYALLYHHHEIKLGFIELFNSFRKGKKRDESRYEDVHNRLMAAYKEVPEWWFITVLLIAIFFGVFGVCYWPTYTSPLVVFYGILLCVLFIVPIGVIKSITGVEVNLGILAEFIGGSIVPGNALAMNYMKAYGFVTCSHAIWFSNDLKLAHYVKIPQRQTFAVQMFATMIGTFVCTAVLNFQMRNIPGVCTVDAPNRFTCPYVNSFVAASVLWGTIGPAKMFGPDGQYTLLLLGFPFGFALVMGFWFIKKRFKNASWLRQVHPVVMLSGAIHWAPYNIGYIWPAVPIAWFSWLYMKRRYLELWARYNYILSAAFSAGIAIAGLVMFFAVQWPGVKLNWWGNEVVYEGCEAMSNPCRLNYLEKKEYFGPRIGDFH